MKRWKVVFAATALSDLRETAIYIQEQLGSPQAALGFLDKVDEKVRILESAPESFARVREYDLYQAGYRWCSVGNFLMFFTVNAEDGQVSVERVLYGARDWKSLL